MENISFRVVLCFDADSPCIETLKQKTFEKLEDALRARGITPGHHQLEISSTRFRDAQLIITGKAVRTNQPGWDADGRECCEWPAQ